MQGQFIKKIKCLCPQCLEIVDAEVVEEDGKIWLNKHCNKDGTFKSLHLLSNPSIYHTLAQLHRNRNASPEGLLIYLTRKCNQYCPYCFVNANEEVGEEPSTEEIVARAKSFSGGIIYLFGGEPTLREDLFEIIKKIKENRFKVVLFTNGKKLVNPDYVKGLKKAGLDVVILQFDSLSDSDYIKIRGEELLESKTRAVNNLRKHALCLMLYVNVVEGINSGRIIELFDFALQNDNVKILFFNPLWNIGRQASKEELNSAGMLNMVCRELKIGEEYFIDCTRFSTYVFEILRKMKFRKGIKEPPCSVSCYLIRRGRGYLPLDSFVDLKKLNSYLESLEQRVNFRKNILSNIIRLVFCRDLYLFLSGIVLNRKILKVFLDNFLYNLKHPKSFQSLYFMFFNILSIMVGQFPDKHNLDLSLIKTCNMHTALDNKRSLPTCLYEIYREAGKIA